MNDLSVVLIFVSVSLRESFLPCFLLRHSSIEFVTSHIRVLLRHLDHARLSQ